MPSLQSRLQDVIDDRRRRDLYTGSRPTVPPPQPGLPSGRPQKAEGDPASFATRAFTPALLTAGQSSSLPSTVNVSWVVVSAVLTPATNPYGTKQTYAKYAKVGGKGPSAPGVSTQPNPATILPGDTVANPDGGGLQAQSGSQSTGAYYDPSDYGANLS